MHDAQPRPTPHHCPTAITSTPTTASTLLTSYASRARRFKMSNELLSIAELQSRLNDLELSKTHDNAAEILRKERTDMLLALRKIMAAMKSEDGLAGGASSKEMEALKAENEELKKVNAKQKYRIEHLVHNLRSVIDGESKS